jgi:FkbM family methyltransferase
MLGKLRFITADIFRLLSEYIRYFGFRGIAFAFYHPLKIKFCNTNNHLKINVPGYGSVYLRPKTCDLATFKEIFIYGEYALKQANIFAPVYNRYLDILSKGEAPIIIDAGANVGLASIFLSINFPLAKIIAVEADNDNLSMAILNASRISSFLAINAALWDKSEPLFFQKSNTTVTGRVVKDNALNKNNAVAGKTIDEILSYEAKNLFLLKMDIEGGEAIVLSSDLKSSNWIKSFPAILVEPHDGSFNVSGSISGLMNIEDYRNGIIKPNSNSLFLIPKPMIDNYS